MAESEPTTAWAERGISIGGSSLYLPLIMGAGVGVWEGYVVAVGMGVFVIGVWGWVEAGVGATTVAVPHEV